MVRGLLTQMAPISAFDKAYKCVVGYLKASLLSVVSA